jgi:hypothetical protein
LLPAPTSLRLLLLKQVGMYELRRLRRLGIRAFAPITILQSTGLFKPKELGGTMAVAAVILSSYPLLAHGFFFLASLLSCQDRGLGPLVHFPVCHVMGSLRPISISRRPQPKSPRGSL